MTIEDKKPKTVFDSPRTLLSGEATPAQFAAAFEEIFGEPYEKLAAYAMGYALRLTRGNAADADDLVQDAFLRLFKHTYAGPVRGRAYLSTILANLHRDRLRRRKTEIDKLGARTGLDIALDEQIPDRTDYDVAEAVVKSMEAGWISAEIRERIDALVTSFADDEQRRSLQALLDLENGSLRKLEEVAQLTGFHISKVKKHCRGFKSRLVEALADLPGWNDPRNLA